MLGCPLHYRGSNAVASMLGFSGSKYVAAFFFDFGRQIDGVSNTNDLRCMLCNKDIALEKLPDSPAAPAAEATTAAAPVDAKTTADAGPLFNGRDLTGWGGEAAAFWSVVDGALTSSGAPQPRGSWLRTDRELENFDLTFRARTQGRVGTGLFFRSAVEPGKRILGWQVDIGPGLDGGLYKEGPRGGLISYPDKAKLNGVAKTGDWNTYRIRAEGRRLRTWVNGIAMQDHEEKGPRRTRGVIALELSPGSTGRRNFSLSALMK